MKRNAVATVGSAGAAPRGLRRSVETLGRLGRSAITPCRNLPNGKRQIREATK